MEQKNCLLLIDMQNGMFTWKQPVYRPEKLMANLTSAVLWARGKGIPVIYMQHDDDAMMPLGSEKWEFVDAISPQAGDTVIPKRHPNAFEETELHGMLQKAGITQLIVGGVNSSYCVQASCEGAVSLGYRVILLKDGHSTVLENPERVIADVHKALGEKGVKIAGVGDVMG